MSLTICPTSGIALALVTQFTIVVDEEQLACILRDLANVNGPENQRVNIRAYLQLFSKKKCKTLFKFVPGSDDAPQGTAIPLTEAVLERYCIPFTTKTVIEVGIPNIPGGLAFIQAVFNAAGIRILASYIDESPSEANDGFPPSVYEVDDVQRAFELLCGSTEQQLRALQASATLNCCCLQPCHCHKKHKCHREERKHTDCK